MVSAQRWMPCSFQYLEAFFCFVWLKCTDIHVFYEQLRSMRPIAPLPFFLSLGSEALQASETNKSIDMAKLSSYHKNPRPARGSCCETVPTK